MPTWAGTCRNWDPGTYGKHQSENEKLLICQHGLVGAQIVTLGPVARAGAARPAATKKAAQGMKSVRGQAGGWRVHGMQNGEEVPPEDHAEESIAGELP